MFPFGCHFDIVEKKRNIIVNTLKTFDIDNLLDVYKRQRMDTSPVTCRTLDDFYHIDASTFEKQYKDVLSLSLIHI